jgi:hypothetical protein
MRTISCFLSRLRSAAVWCARLSPHETVLIDRMLSVGRFGHIISALGSSRTQKSAAWALERPLRYLVTLLIGDAHMQF